MSSDGDRSRRRERLVLRSASQVVAVAAALAVATTAAGAAAAPARPIPVTERASQGAVAAELSYVKEVDPSGFTSYRRLRLTITRDGRVVPSRPPSRSVPLDLLWPGASYAKAKSVHVEDLDGDGEPEVELDLYTGGAHCCWILYAYRWNGSSYAAQALQSGSSGYKRRDLDGDGRPEWLTADPRFEYLFTAFAASGVPVRIYDYRGGRFVAVTASYPALVRADAARWWRLYRRHRTDAAPDNRGLLAAWAADMCTLGRCSEVWPALRAANSRGDLRGDGPPTGLAYIDALRRKLRAFGYLR